MREIETTRAGRNAALFEAQQLILPIQIRPDLTVNIQGIPWDLTTKEASKIVAVIEGMASK